MATHRPSAGAERQEHRLTSSRALRETSGPSSGSSGCRCESATPRTRRGVHAHGVRHRHPRRRAVGARADADHPLASGDGVCHVENARWLARNLPDARYVELDGRRSRPLVRRHRARARRDPRVPDRRARGRGARPRARDGALHRRRRLDRACGGARRPPLARAARVPQRRGRRELDRFRGRQSTAPATASSRPSTARPRDPLRGADPDAVPRSGSRSGPGCTPARSRCSATTSRGMAVHIGARVAAQRRRRARSSSPGTVRDLVVGLGHRSSRTAAPPS